MKEKAPLISAALLIGYAIFCAIAPASIPHAIIFTSLAGLFAYNQFLLSHSTPKLEDEIAKLKSEIEKQLAQQKESHDKELSKLEGELTKMSITTIKSNSPSSKTSERPQYKF